MGALIVGVKYKEMNYDLDNSLIELEELCKACNIQVVKKCIQNLDRINPSLYIGTGKVHGSLSEPPGSSCGCGEN